MPERSDPNPTVDLNDHLHTALTIPYRLDPGPLPAEAATRYRIDGEIGHGGMGSVLRGYDPHLGRDIAVKVLLEKHANDLELKRRFVEEAQIGGQLQHPGVVPVYELGQSPDQRPYFTMKLVKGQTLATKLAGRSTPQDNLPRFLTIFEQVCQTVAYAHARRVIHRDLKPLNVMVGSFGEVQVMDWGLAKVLPPTDSTPAETAPMSEITNIRTVSDGSTSAEQRVGTYYGMGTYGYMPPEQALGDVAQIDERADVFALGAMLCCILTGEAPYVGSAAELKRQTIQGDLRAAFARLESSGSDPELVKLCKECLTVDLQARLPNAEVVAARVTAYQVGVQERLRQAELARVAELARAEEAVATAAQERKARRLTLGLAASVLLLLTGGAAAGFWYQHDREARRTELAGHMAETEKAVSLALAKADQATARADRPSTTNAAAQAALADWREAAAALAEADAVLTTGAGTEDLRERVAEMRSRIEAGQTQALRKERLFRELDEARLAMAVLVGNTYDYAGAATKYHDAFVAYGLEITPGDTKELVRRIGAEETAVRAALLAGLDDWIIAASNGGTTPAAADLCKLAAAADDDPWRRRLRVAMVVHDVATLRDAGVEARRSSLPPSSLILLARNMYETGEHAEAVALLRWGRNEHPTDFWIHFELGTHLTQATEQAPPLDLEEGIGCLRAAVALRPRATVVYVNLGLALSAKKQWDDAIAAFKTAEALDPKYRPVYLSLGNALVGKEQWDDAVAAYRQAITLNSNDALAHNNLGNVLKNKEQLDDAIAEFQLAIALDSKYLFAHYNLGAALVDKNQLDDAVVEYKKAIAIDPKYTPAHVGLGIVLGRKNQLDDAIAEFKKAIAIDPKYVFAHYNLGLAFASKNQGGDAIAAFNQTIALDPKYAPAHFNLGDVLMGKNQWDDAIAAFKKGLALDPKNGLAHYHLGLAHQGKNQVDDAIAEFKTAIVLDAKLAAAHVNLGAALADKKKLDDAIAEFKKAIEIEPTEALAHFGLGYSLLQQGHFADAKTSIQQALKLLPENSPLRPRIFFMWHHCAWLQESEAKLPDILAGKTQPANADERRGLIEVCRLQERHVAAAKLYADAFIADTKLADDMEQQHRYNAACFAALAAAGQGTDVSKLDDKERARLRQQALDWLRADLAHWTKQAASDKPGDREVVQKTLKHWQDDTDLAGIRDKEALTKLPADERERWQKLWADVVDQLRKAQKQPDAADPEPR